VLCFDGCVTVMQNDSVDKTREADGSNETQQQMEQFRYENDKLKIALAQRSHSTASTLTIAIHDLCFIDLFCI